MRLRDMNSESDNQSVPRGKDYNAHARAECIYLYIHNFTKETSTVTLMFHFYLTLTSQMGVKMELD